MEDALWMDLGLTRSNEPNLKLRRAAQVLELGFDEAKRGYPVDLAGVVTWSSPEERIFFLQDSTRGICVDYSAVDSPVLPETGRSVRVIGRSAASVFAPRVLCDSIEGSSGFRLPVPRSMTLAQLQDSAEEAKLVEVIGYLRSVEEEGPWAILTLSTPTGVFHAKMPADDELEEVRSLVGAVIRLHGVCITSTDSSNQLGGIEILLTGRRAMDVEVPSLSDPFAVGTIPIDELRKTGPLQSPFRWVRTLGVVTYVSGQRIIIQAGKGGLEVYGRGQVSLKPGDAVEVVGFVGREQRRVVLREALVRSSPRKDELHAAEWDAGRAIDPDLDNVLVQVDAVLEDSLKTDRGRLLYLQVGGVRFLGYSDFAGNANLRKGSQCRCTGVYRVVPGHIEKPESFELFFRDADDIVVLQPPSVFTARNATIAMVMVSVAAIAALLGNILLRK